MSAPGLDSAACLDLPMWGGKFGLLVPKEALAGDWSAQHVAEKWTDLLVGWSYLRPACGMCAWEAGDPARWAMESLHDCGVTEEQHKPPSDFYENPKEPA